MKLRNKKTGEIIEVCKICPEPFEARDFDCNSLAELNEEWEDWEEPKEFYVVDFDGEILPSDFEDKTIEKSKELGNYFKTKEEAEKAVEKLKAWKRLKDKGFRFVEYRNTLANVGCPYRFIIEASVDACKKADLDLLFGGEE